MGLLSGMTAKGAAQLLANTFLPDTPTDRFIFRRFKGDALLQAVQNGTQVSQDDIITVVLQVNPQEMVVVEQKLTNKVPTNAPERFVIFDWGNDITTFQITGCTGQLLPSSVTRKYDDKMKAVDNLIEATAEGISSVTSEVMSGFTVKAGFMSTMGYFQMIEMAPKYRTFRRLYEYIYRPFDADRDILTLEMGEFVYRCYFTDFSFTISKDSPWNWNYSMGISILADLSEKENRGDSNFTENATVMAWE